MPKQNTTIPHSSAIHEEKFKALFREYFSSLCVFACRYLSDPDLAKDAVHDVFTRLWESKGQLDQLLNEKSYLYTLVRNRCLDLLRNQTVRQKYANTPDFTDKGNEEFLEAEILREETYRLLDRAINELPERSQEILRLKLKGFKNQEIAEKLNLSVNTVNTLKTNSYKILRKILKDKFLICWIFFLFDETDQA